jgi:cellobiose phosphorylase
VLDESAPFFHPDGDARAEHATVLAHVERALALIARRVIPGTRLAAYGHGDWNDSLQPADPALAERLCSAWTVTLHHQTLETLATALRARARRARRRARGGAAADPRRLPAPARRRRRRDRLAHFGRRRRSSTGCTRAIASAASATACCRWSTRSSRTCSRPSRRAHHVEVIRRHLLAPTARACSTDRCRTAAGIQRHFQRAETGTFFGREIGLMYTHAHLRYAEAMAHLGDAEAFYERCAGVSRASRSAWVPNARRRQVNCYTSSSDAAFPDRYQAARATTRCARATSPWRAAGACTRAAPASRSGLVREHLLGDRLRTAELGIDPCCRARSTDCARSSRSRAGRSSALPRRRARIRTASARVERIRSRIRAQRQPCTSEGGARVAMTALRERLRADANTLLVDLG